VAVPLDSPVLSVQMQRPKDTASAERGRITPHPAAIRIQRTVPRDPHRSPQNADTILAAQINRLPQLSQLFMNKIVTSRIFPALEI
jgi:hypothetical protein